MASYFKDDLNRWRSILNAFEPLKKQGWKDCGNGAALIGHDPTDYPLYFHIRIHSALDDKSITEIQNQSGKRVYESTRNFYYLTNGLSLFQELSIHGVIRESDGQAGQPISLRYGNIHEVPSNLPENSIVIGGVSAADNRIDYLVSHSDGSISQSFGTNQFEEVKKWKTVFDTVEFFIDKNSQKFPN